MGIQNHFKNHLISKHVFKIYPHQESGEARRGDGDPPPPGG